MIMLDVGALQLVRNVRRIILVTSDKFGESVEACLASDRSYEYATNKGTNDAHVPRVRTIASSSSAGRGEKRVIGNDARTTDDKGVGDWTYLARGSGNDGTFSIPPFSTDDLDSQGRRSKRNTDSAAASATRSTVAAKSIKILAENESVQRQLYTVFDANNLPSFQLVPNCAAATIAVGRIPLSK